MRRVSTASVSAVLRFLARHALWVSPYRPAVGCSARRPAAATEWSGRILLRWVEPGGARITGRRDSALLGCVKIAPVLPAQPPDAEWDEQEPRVRHHVRDEFAVWTYVWKFVNLGSGSRRARTPPHRYHSSLHSLGCRGRIASRRDRIRLPPQVRCRVRLPTPSCREVRAGVWACVQAHAEVMVPGRCAVSACGNGRGQRTPRRDATAP